MENNFINLIMDFLKEAGEIAIERQKNLTANLKNDSSIVTDVDLQISSLFHKKIKNLLDTKNHILLDEENLPERNEFFNNKAEYLWTLDPIDGTTTYYHGFPLWATGISLYKNFKPYLSAIYMPSVKELVYTDNTKSYIITNPFTIFEEKNEIVLKDKQLTNKSVILEHKLNIKEENRRKFTLLDLYACYVLGFYTILGRSQGCFFNKPAKLWDITAILPIVKNLGLNFTNLDNNKELDELSPDIIDDNWYLKYTFLICKSCEFESIKEIYNK